MADLDYSSMGSPPEDQPADATERWAMYLFDAWYSDELAPYLVAPPLKGLPLAEDDIRALQRGAGPDELTHLVEALAPHVTKDAPVFVRTSMCSTKIGTTIRPCASAVECIQAISDSSRCIAALAAPGRHSIWLFPWQEKCDILREFRVFVTAGQVVAMCPYYCSCFQDWITPGKATEVAEAIVDFWGRIRQLVSLQELVMDVLHTRDGEVLLIEVNPPFTSGGALFDWQRDASLLAGRAGELPLMRIIGE